MVMLLKQYGKANVSLYAVVVKKKTKKTCNFYLLLLYEWYELLSLCIQLGVLLSMCCKPSNDCCDLYNAANF